MGHKLGALRKIFFSVDFEKEVILSCSEMSLNVSHLEDSDIFPVDANDLCALSDDTATGNLHGNRGLLYLGASLYGLAFDPQLKG